MSFRKSHIKMGAVRTLNNWMVQKTELRKEIESYLRQASILCLRMDLQVMVKLYWPFCYRCLQNSNSNWITLQSNLVPIFGNFSYIYLFFFFLSFFFLLFLMFGVIFLLGWFNVSLLWSSEICNIPQSIFHRTEPN